MLDRRTAARLAGIAALGVAVLAALLAGRRLASRLEGVALERGPATSLLERPGTRWPIAADRPRVLRDGEVLRVDLAGAGQAELAVEARSTAPGTLELRVLELDPLDSSVAGGALFERLLEFGPEQPVAREQLPDLPARLQRIELRWAPRQPGVDLTFDRLTLARAAHPVPPLIVFLSVDTLGAQHMSLHGYSRPTTPFLERFAERAVVFDAALANSGWTMPSYASQLSGLRPNALLAADAAAEPGAVLSKRYRIAEPRTTLAELLAAAGYETHAIVDSRMLALTEGYRQGFESVDTSPMEVDLWEPEGGLERVTALALERVDNRDPERPLFLFLQAVDPHGPYVTRAPWAGRFDSPEPHTRALVVPNT
ncbi:MAG: sulfatase-like hydrolase/transferase, partial [Planctomycetota bacterium]